MVSYDGGIITSLEKESSHSLAILNLNLERKWQASLSCENLDIPNGICLNGNYYPLLLIISLGFSIA